ncbi:MAG: DUF1080 domain-containing protein [Gemmatimonadaceae bacterium]|nr:DUF1080 domain-containing protein [Gemmatimonadaceae bacterium]
MRRSALLLPLLLAVGCITITRGASSQWRSLLEPNGASAWRAYRADTIPSGWRVVDGVLSKERPTGDLISRERFSDFELELEWRISPGGNAGIFYRGTEEYDHIYWSAPEFQLLDDAGNRESANRLTAAGANYGLYPSLAGQLRPAGEWNRTRIIVKGPHVEHWLNGTMVVTYELGSPEWTAKVGASKFRAYPNYGRAASGHIGLQGDHDGTLAFRNIRIRAL